MNSRDTNILWLRDVSNKDVLLVGGKNASLGEMYNNLSAKGINVPDAFIVTAAAYRFFVEETGIGKTIAQELNNLDTHDIRELQKRGRAIRHAFTSASMPKKLIKEIHTAYEELSAEYDATNVDVAVRSSATAEDLPGASFAGQQETYLGVTGKDAVVEAVRKAFASLFTDRAISYRTDKGFDHQDVALSVGVQKMVRSDLASAGVMFTIDTETGFRDVVQIDSSWGLGEMVVQGKVTPDEFIVFKPKLDGSHTPIIKRDLGKKRKKLVYSERGPNPTKEVAVSQKEQELFTLTEEEVLKLARWGVAIEEHYSDLAGKDRPMDMEWAKDGIDGELYIVQARPETVQSEKKTLSITDYHLKTDDDPIVEGIAVGRQVVAGTARIIQSTAKLSDFKEGEVLVTELTDPDWEPIMKKAKAIVTEKGGRTSHAAIVSRELGIPAVIGAEGAMGVIKTGQDITIDTSSGTVGKIFDGTLAWDEVVHNIESVPETNTDVCMNIGTPEGAFVYSFLPHKGVGLAREEFIFASHIQVHPLALLNYNTLDDAKLKKKIDTITVGYEDKKDFFVTKLSEGIAQIGAAFHPHPVIVRFSDFRSNEYRGLLGGSLYEPEEENPMIGWRGASRYVHEDFKPAFMLECEAIKRVREDMGIDNVHVMVPFCRTPEEGRQVIAIMEETGLEKGVNDLKVYVMCEIPTNVIRADDFLDVFDGFSIGSNDLTQLTLGIDRDSAIVAPIANENDPAVRELVGEAIRACKRRGKYIGFCGQAPSDYPEFTRFLVEENIDSISLNPDSVISMTLEINEAEKRS